MRLLLDTHAFLWFVLDDPQLSQKARALISSPSNEAEISPTVYWELAIKIALGKYSLAEPIQDFMEHEILTNRFQILPIEQRHVGPLTTLPVSPPRPF